MPKRFVIAVLASLLAACASTSTSVSGQYFWGHEVEAFQPCGSSQSFWVVGESKLLQPLRDKAMELSKAKGKPYQPVYVEISIVSEKKADDGFAADYDGVYRLITVHSVSAVSPPGCKAHG